MGLATCVLVQLCNGSTCVDRDRRKVGLKPLPAFVPPPEPVSEERKKEILADPRITAVAARVCSLPPFSAGLV